MNHGLVRPARVFARTCIVEFFQCANGVTSMTLTPGGPIAPTSITSDWRVRTIGGSYPKHLQTASIRSRSTALAIWIQFRVNRYSMP